MIQYRYLLLAEFLLTAYRIAGALEPALAGPMDSEYRQAKELFAQHQYKKVLPIVDSIIELSPNNANAYALRGRAVLELEKPQDAVSDLKHALALDSKLVRARTALARCDYETGRYDDAIREITTVLEQDEPVDDKCYHLCTRASYYEKIGKYNEALADANKALQLKTSYGNIRERADLYMLMKQYELASKDYTKAIELGKKSDADKLYELRARAYDAMGRKDLAIKDRNSAGKSLNQDPMYYLLHP